METWEIGRHPPEQVLAHLRGWAPPGEGVVCFDYFDTLVVREVEPEHTKRIAAALLAAHLQCGIDGPTLYAQRRQLELELCRRNAEQGGELEFALAELARIWFEALCANCPDALTGHDAESFAKLVLAQELAVERVVQRPCPQTVELARRLHLEGYRLLLVSDFYLPREIYLEMVRAQGMGDLFEDMYVSIDHGVNKGSGRLYDKISRDLGLRPERLCMLGDNPHADVAMARERGLATLRVDNPAQRAFYQQWRKERPCPFPQGAWRIQAAWGKEQGTGIVEQGAFSGPFAEMGLTLWLFTWRLLQDLLRLRVRDAVFFSKEGELLRFLFDSMQDRLLGQRPIRSHYLLVSRKATFLASLRPLEQEDFHRIFNHYRDISPRDFFLSLNLEEAWCRSLCDALEIDFTARHHNLPGREEFVRLLATPAFRCEYETRRQEQRRNLHCYLDSLGLDHRRRGLNIVDVGWKGSIQDNVYWSLDGEVDVQGWYLGSLIATELTPNNRKRGLLFDDRAAQTPSFTIYNNNRSLFEMMLGATHGSADGYYTEAQWAALPPDPQRRAHTVVETPEGRFMIAVRDLPEERELYHTWIAPLQKGFLQTAALLSRATILADGRPPSDEWFARHHARMVFRPTDEEVELFSRLYHLENFGVFEYTDFRVHESPSLRRRLGHLRAIWRRPELLESGIWPPIILNRLGIGWYRHVDGRLRLRRAFPRRSR